MSKKIKISKTASGKKVVKISKQQWFDLGEKAGWTPSEEDGLKLDFKNWHLVGQKAGWFNNSEKPKTANVKTASKEKVVLTKSEWVRMGKEAKFFENLWTRISGKIWPSIQKYFPQAQHQQVIIKSLQEQAATGVISAEKLKADAEKQIGDMSQQIAALEEVARVGQEALGRANQRVDQSEQKLQDIKKPSEISPERQKARDMATLLNEKLYESMSSINQMIGNVQGKQHLHRDIYYDFKEDMSDLVHINSNLLKNLFPTEEAAIQWNQKLKTNLNSIVTYYRKNVSGSGSESEWKRVEDLLRTEVYSPLQKLNEQAKAKLGEQKKLGPELLKL